MVSTNTFVRTLGTAGIALMALAGPSLADDKFGVYVDHHGCQRLSVPRHLVHGK